MESTINLCRLRSPEAALTTGDDPPPIWLAELPLGDFRGPHLLGKFLSEMAQHDQHDRFRSSRSSRSSRSFQSLSGGYWNIWNTLLFSKNITYFALQWRSFPGEACSWNPERTMLTMRFCVARYPSSDLIQQFLWICGVLFIPPKSRSSNHMFFVAMLWSRVHLDLLQFHSLVLVCPMV